MKKRARAETMCKTRVRSGGVFWKGVEVVGGRGTTPRGDKKPSESLASGEQVAREQAQVEGGRALTIKTWGSGGTWWDEEGEIKDESDGNKGRARGQGSKMFESSLWKEGAASEGSCGPKKQKVNKKKKKKITHYKGQKEKRESRGKGNVSKGEAGKRRSSGIGGNASNRERKKTPQQGAECKKGGTGTGGVKAIRAQTGYFIRDYGGWLRGVMRTWLKPYSRGRMARRGE